MDRMLSEMGGRFGCPVSLAAQTLLATSAQTIVASSGRALVLLWIGLQVGARQAFVAVLGNFSDSVRLHFLSRCTLAWGIHYEVPVAPAINLRSGVVVLTYHPSPLQPCVVPWGKPCWQGFAVPFGMGISWLGHFA